MLLNKSLKQFLHLCFKCTSVLTWRLHWVWLPCSTAGKMGSLIFWNQQLILFTFKYIYLVLLFLDLFGFPRCKIRSCLTPKWIFETETLALKTYKRKARKILRQCSSWQKGMFNCNSVKKITLWNNENFWPKYIFPIELVSWFYIRDNREEFLT